MKNYGDEVTIAIEGGYINGFLKVPFHARGIILFAHGSGSSRFSSRNNFVADVLNQSQLATLLIDLLTPEESESRSNVFDIELLAGRLSAAHQWVRNQPDLQELRVGYFGASTGAAAALVAAVKNSDDVSAVVSRGGRPDLALMSLPKVKAPTCLIVGERDPDVYELNLAAYDKLQGTKDLVTVPGATHLFEEPGTLELVSDISSDWFKRYLIDQKGMAPGPMAPGLHPRTMD